MTEHRDRKYLRIYYNDLEREYPEIWASPALLWAFVRLLSVAEAMWPTIPEVPRAVKTASVRALMASGIVIGSGPHGFRIRGLDAERNRRRASAKRAAGRRWEDADSNANGNAPRNAGGETRPHPNFRMPNRTEPNRTEPKNLPTSARGLTHISEVVERIREEVAG